jgi:Skp family chaperone for outer membrane proteins
MNKLTFGAAAAALALTLPTAAPAQRIGGAIIAVVDTGRVGTECTACRAAQAQLQTQIQQAQQRAQQLQTPLQTEETALQNAVRALAGKQPDAALQGRIKAFQDKQNSAAQELANRQRTLQLTEAHVNKQINDRLGPIVNTVMNSRGANIVLPKGATLANSPALDITNDVLAQLNQQLPSVSVTPLPQAQQQQPQGR